MLGRLKHCAEQQAGLDHKMKLLAESIEALIDHAGARGVLRMGGSCTAACLHEKSIRELGSLTMQWAVGHQGMGAQSSYLHTLRLTGTGCWLGMVLNMQLSLLALV